MKSCDGVLLIDKPSGLSSRRIDNIVAGLFKKEKLKTKVGHLGTLDPFASGLLPILVGKATRIAEYLHEGRKEYVADIRLGWRTDTLDPEGEVVAESDVGEVSQEEMEAAAKRLTGEIKQKPPVFSAVKKDGRPAYKAAREGRAIELPERNVQVFEFEIEKTDLPLVTARISCSAGTYIRALGRDFGEILGLPASLAALRRTKVGDFDIEQAVEPDTLQSVNTVSEALVSLGQAMSHLPKLAVDDVSATKISHGLWPHGLDGPQSGVFGVVAQTSGELTALAEFDASNGKFRIKKVFADQD